MKLPILAGQTDLLLDQEISGHSSSHRGYTVEFPPHVRPEHIVVGLELVVRNFGALRSRFSGAASSGYQQTVELPERHALDIEFHDVTDGDAVSKSRYFMGILYRDAVEWDWERRGAYRFLVAKSSDKEYKLIVSMQQVAIDRDSAVLVLNALRSSILAVARDSAPKIHVDRYESAITGSCLTSVERAAARRYWENELDLDAEALRGSLILPPMRPHFHRVTRIGAAYQTLKRSAGATAWGPCVMFLTRLVDSWRMHNSKIAIIDVFHSIRSVALARQVGMFSTIRPIVLDVSNKSWKTMVTGKLLRAAANQQFDSMELRSLEVDRGVPRRPFPVFSYIGEYSPSDNSDLTEMAPWKKFSSPHSSTRPIAVSIRDTGSAFTIDLCTHPALFSIDESLKLLDHLVLK
ncbi:hypothetical protein [Nocardia carnea]|uniref:hypothetical protein n=1 Tax=Nocardia carnea TaxID=37328 RepID=UPI0024554D19|nr:hypothetical protein [Nocardia carnea]